MSQGIILEEDIETYVPSTKEIEEYAEYIGINLKTEKHLLWIAKEGLKEPLPSEWKAYMTNAGEIYYHNSSIKESTWEHPLDEKYKKKYQREKEKGLRSRLVDDIGAQTILEQDEEYEDSNSKQSFQQSLEIDRSPQKESKERIRQNEIIEKERNMALKEFSLWESIQRRESKARITAYQAKMDKELKEEFKELVKEEEKERQEKLKEIKSSIQEAIINERIDINKESKLVVDARLEDNKNDLLKILQQIREKKKELTNKKYYLSQKVQSLINLQNILLQ